MSFILVMGMILAAWAGLRVIAGERHRRLRQMMAEKAALEAAKAKAKAASQSIPTVG